ncbi:xanthine dehydrogenase accessory protein XdhC [Arthrobacter castelli]|uniref:xanthine dehydrogenase accessory protein XdhC n=1 Tax=Arthrobacter castelli TaxID=271431 RepID=UPI000425AC5E|nr:xanthine dehydrogenase accessory protein XdhC [Arthrobacter castelli]
MDWLTGVEHFRSSRQPGVIVTVVSSRGHAPRRAGAKMAISSDAAWGSVGGGNLEATAVKRARELLEDRISEPEMITLQLSDKAPAEHGVQCCGGEVTMLVEPVRLPAAVAIFGVGHVGLELARILARHDVELHLVDSRADMLKPDRLAVLDDANADIRAHHEPIPETALRDLPHATHILIMTHDHAEDAALCDAALRTPSVATIGLIGSQSKWRRFQKQLREVGHSDDAIDRIQTPIGISGIASKEPAAIAVAVAAGLLQTLESAD